MSTIFDAYAVYYDLLYQDKPYAAEVQYIAKLLQTHGGNGKQILELGCGTGAHAENLARLGFEVDGIDSSQRMLKAAKTRRSNLPPDLAERLRFSFGDLRTFRAEPIFGQQHYDVILSLFHVFSYQVRNEDVREAFTTAAAHLEPGGVLLFDFWYGPAVLTQRPEIRLRRFENEEIAVMRIAEPIIHYDEDRVQVNYTVLIKKKAGGEIEQVQECHDMRYFFLPEIELLASPFFRTKEHLAWMSSTQPTSEDWSAVCIMERLPGNFQ